MASFGWSAGDVIAVATLAWKLYKTCESAGEEYRSLAVDVRTLQSLLQDVGNELGNPSSVIHRAGKSKRRQLVILIEDCNTDLGDLERYLLQYKSLKTAKPRFRDRLRFGIKPISQIRLKLSQHTDGLNLFLTHVNTSSLGRLEQSSETSAGALDDIRAKLDDLRKQVEMGQKDIAVLDFRRSWADLEKELVGDRVTERDVTSNRDSIQQYISRWLDTTAHDKPSEQQTAYQTRRTSSMMPWSPSSSIGPLEDQVLAGTHARHLARAPSLDGSMDELWNHVGRASPSVASEVPMSEDLSTVAESVFSSDSSPSSGTTTPEIPGSPVCGRYLDDDCATLKGLGLTDRSCSEAGIDSLIDELDAFVLDISRSSTPTVGDCTVTDDSELNEVHGYEPERQEVHNLYNAMPERRVITRPLPLTLEEVFTGGCKTKRIRGRLQAERNDQNELELRESTIEVHYPPGAKPGMVIDVPDVGVDVRGFPQDLRFIVEVKPHNSFQWDGKDLTTVVKISLLESLCGWSKAIPTINGSELQIERSEVTPPSWSMFYPGMGMPCHGNGQRSDLIVKVDVEYPESISLYQNKIFNRILTPKAELSPRMQQMLCDG